MTPARARLAVTASGVVVAAVAAVALGVFGGPGEARRAERDSRRLEHLSEIVAAVTCHVRAGADPARPAALVEITAACLAPTRAAAFVDPLTGAAYPLDYPDAGTVRVCATLERPEPRPWMAPAFDAATGCLAAALTAGAAG